VAATAPQPSPSAVAWPRYAAPSGPLSSRCA